METFPVTGKTTTVSEQPVGIPLTPGLCLFHFFFAVVWLLLCAVATLTGILTDDKGCSLMNLVLTVIYGPNVWVKWKQYRRVSCGVVLYSSPNRFRLSPAVSVIAFGLLTLLAMGATIFSVVLLQPWVRSGILRDDLLMVSAAASIANVFLWGYVAYCWYRLSLQRLQSKPQEILTEPTEDVWPPAPTQKM